MVVMRPPRIHSALAQGRRSLLWAWHGFSHLLWPPVCSICGQGICEDDNGLCPTCWDQIHACTAEEYCPRCGRNASRYGLVDGCCPACQGTEIHFDAIARAGVYADALQRMILAFKHDHTELLSIVATLIGAAFAGSGFATDVDLLVPVPLHWTRRLRRGYNQSHLLAKCLRHSPIGIDTDLVRIRRTKAQPTVATAAARARNVKGAFAVRPDHRLAGRRLCLVDDINTSGATLNECAQTLKDAGATKVYAIVLAVAGQRLS